MSWFTRKSSSPLTPDAQASLDRLRAMRWPAFEALMAAAFAHRGYTVEKTGKGGADGDIDLVLSQQGRTELAQCKPWKTRETGIAAVREMWGVRGHRDADVVWIIRAGHFTDEALRFAEGKPIECVAGARLLDLVRDVRVPEPAPAPIPRPATPPCPRCGAATFQRFNLQTQAMYWGCIGYPACKGSLPL